MMYETEEYYEDVLDKEEWFYIVRIGTNERFINKSDDINVAKKPFVTNLLAELNRNGNRWEAMSIAQYDRKFGGI